MRKLFFSITSFAVGLLHLAGCAAQDKKLMGHGEKILIIGRHPDMLARISEMLKNHQYHPVGVTTNEEALQTFATEKPQAVIIGGGVDAESRRLFHEQFSPAAKVIDAHPQTVLSDLKAAFPDKE